MNNIYKTLASNITTYYIDKKIISKENLDVYSYGFEVLISNTVYTIIFITLSIITGTLLESIFFWIGFYILRTICGGYHAKSYLKCHILFLVNHILFMLALQMLNNYNLILSELLIYVSAVIVLVTGPVSHPNKPFIKNEKSRFKKISKYYSVFILIFYSIAFIVPSGNLWRCLYSFSIGTFSAAISLMSAKFIYKKGV